MPLNLDKKLIAQEFEKNLSLQDLENLRLKYLGKKGSISLEMKSLSTLPIEEKKN